ncbi:MAG: 4Fe-4S binding protein [Candidatus Lokiarchaeota archaeon]|nr:4Fe-4S binding protein [Candidatus Lokiarchaeota archaeon]
MPNSINFIKLFLKKCVGCGICVESCPHYAIPSSLIGFISSIAKINEDKCDFCGKCVQACSHGALMILNKEGL